MALALSSMSAATSTKYKPTTMAAMMMISNSHLQVSCVAMRPEKTTKSGKFRPIKEIEGQQVKHSLSPEKLEIFNSMESWAEHNLLTYLKPVEKAWQPQDFLPRPDTDEFYDQIRELRKRTQEIPDDYFVALVGDMITEEALPTYQTIMNTLDGSRDETGCSLTPWAIWIRAWTAEENRHGDLLNKYLYLSGRVDMRQVEKTIQYLIGSGFDSKFENNPYFGFIYTSFQERATFSSHGNTARMAKAYGDDSLAKICGIIAADEKRHEAAYTAIVARLFEIDPDGAVQALANMMRKRITMPAHLMHDGEDDNLFEHFASVAQRIGVYTAVDYAKILEYFVQRWKVERLEQGLSGEGRKAQEYLCNLPQRMKRIAERVKLGSKPSVSFSWVFGREVKL